VFNNLGNLADLMRNAGQLREKAAKAAEALGQLRVEGAAGGGAVKVTVSGKLEVLAVRIEPTLLADGDVELLEDLITAAANQALAKAREEAVQSMTGGLPLAGLSGFFGAGPGEPAP
jgi:DNA-binding YbaB/EbfC family protein